MTQPEIEAQGTSGTHARALDRSFREIVDRFADGVVMADDQGLLRYANPAAETMFGYGDGELVGAPMERLIPPRYRPDHQAAVERFGETGISPRGRKVIQVEGLRKDGTAVPIDCSICVSRIGGSPVYTAVLRDISDRMRSEAALRRSEESFRNLIERLPDAVGVHRHGRLVYVNPTLYRALGYDPTDPADSLVGKPVLDILHPDSRGVVAERIRIMLATGEQVPPCEETYIRKDGSLIDAEVVALPLIYDGEPAIVAIARDITERRQIVARTMQMDRMIAIGTLAAGVGHEINNPLTFVVANIGFAIERLDADRALIERAVNLAHRTAGSGGEHDAGAFSAAAACLSDLHEVLEGAREGASRVRDIVRELKSFSRTSDEHQTRVDVTAALDSAINMAFSEIRHRARLVRSYGDTPPVLANESRLCQVFLNLLVNAAHSIPEGASDSNEIRVNTRLDGERIVVEVADSGKGIEPENLGRIFEPFFSTKPVGLGTGLGLSICRQTVDDLGGEILVESVVGQGTTFRVVLPAAGPEAPVVAAAPVATPTPDSAQRARILVVDDEPMVGRVVERSLCSEHDVVTVTAARDALNRLELGEQFDLVLCDLMMPEMTGMDLFDLVTAEMPEVARRFVFITGGAFTPRARELLDSVPNPRIMKPFDPHGLRGAVRESLARLDS